MIYRVVYTEEFLSDLGQHVDFLLAENVPVGRIAAWYDRVLDRLDRLDEMPKRLPVDRVMSGLNGFETRKVNHGDYLAFYVIDDERRVVSLLKFQHGAKSRGG